MNLTWMLGNFQLFCAWAAHPNEDFNLNETPKPDAISIISYFIAAAVLIPIGWWLKAHLVPELAAWSRDWFH